MKDHSNTFWTILAVAGGVAASAFFALQAWEGALPHLERMVVLGPVETTKGLDEVFGLERIELMRVLLWAMTGLLGLGLVYVVFVAVGARSPLALAGMVFLLLLAMTGPPLIAASRTGDPLLMFGAPERLLILENILSQPVLTPELSDNIQNQPVLVLLDPFLVAAVYPALALITALVAGLMRSRAAGRESGKNEKPV